MYAWAAGILVGATYASATSSLAGHSDLLESIIVWLGGILYSIAAYAIVRVVNKLDDHEKRLTKIETKCEDNHKR